MHRSSEVEDATVVATGHHTNLASRLSAIERAQADQAQIVRETTREKRAVQAERNHGRCQ